MPATFPYPPEVEESMRAMYLSLRANDRRRSAAIEAAKLGTEVTSTGPNSPAGAP